MPGFAIVVAADEAGGIGKTGGLPWRLKGDMAYFKRLTQEPSGENAVNAVIMGRLTWDSIPDKFRPLAGRTNLIISGNRDLPLPAGVLRAHSFPDALAQLEQRTDVGRVFVIGGAQIYRLALEHPQLAQVYLTRVQGKLDCDTYLPPLPADLVLLSRSAPQTEGTLSYEYCVYQRQRPA